MALPPLPGYMERIRAHLFAERGMDEAKATSTAIATAVSFCSTGASPNLPVHVNAASRAEACAAVAELKAARRPPAPQEQPGGGEEPQTADRVTDRAWDGSTSRFSPDEYARSCLIDRGPGVASAEERYSLPVREPSGELNRNAVHAAAARIGQVDAPRSLVIAAARKLVSLYRDVLEEEPPDGLLKLAAAAAAASASAKKKGGRTMNHEGEVRTVDVDVRDLDVRGNRVVGYAAVYGALSEDLGGFRERIARGAFAEVLASAPDVRALLNHDVNQVLGRTKSGTLRLADDARGLRFELDLPGSPLGENVREAVRRGDIDGASFRFQCGEDAWDDGVREVRSVARLFDCSLATVPAYPAASVELRSRPPAGEQEEEMETRAGGGLTVADANTGEPEQRALLDRFRAAGWRPGQRAEIRWREFAEAAEQRTVVWSGTIDSLAPIRREGPPLGFDRRYAYPVFPSVSVDGGTTSVQVLMQTGRTLPDPDDVIRDLTATTTKPEVGSERDLVTVSMNQIAAIQSAIPNLFLQNDQLRNVVGVDLRLALNEALDKLVLDAIATAPNHDPTTDPLLISVRKAITILQALGYAPDVLVLRPEDSEALDVLQTSGSEKLWVFGAGRFAPGPIFGLSVRVSKAAEAPVVVDSSAFGTLYSTGISLATFEENSGQTNTSTVRMEGHAAFGVERTDAAVRIDAT